MSTYSDLFKGTAWYYARYRPGYPAEMFDLIRKSFHLDGTGRLLDLGCGTGQMAFDLADHFEEVVGMDPEPEMLAEAIAMAKQLNKGNIKWVCGSSAGLERLSFEMGKFRLVTMGRSFHWMDQGATLRALSNMVVPGGGIALAGDGTFYTSHGEWQQKVREVIQRWLGEERRAGASTYAVPTERHEVTIARSAFKRVEIHEITYHRDWNIETIIGCLYSTSYCSPAILGEKQSLFGEDLRRELLSLQPSGRFSEDVQVEAILAWKDED